MWINRQVGRPDEVYRSLLADGDDYIVGGQFELATRDRQRPAAAVGFGLTQAHTVGRQTGDLAPLYLDLHRRHQLQQLDTLAI